MADDQAQLLALPAGYADPQQSQQVLEELAVELDLLAPGCLALAARRLVRLGLAPLRGGFLLGDGIADAVDERNEEGEVDCARDARAVGQVERREVIDGGLEVGGREPLSQKGLRQDGHGYCGRGIRSVVIMPQSSCGK